MIVTFWCICGADGPQDAKFYDGAVGYEAIICKKCGRMYDHAGEHPADEFSCNFVGITMAQAKEKADFILLAVKNYQRLKSVAILTSGNLRDLADNCRSHSDRSAIRQLAEMLYDATQ